MLLASVQLVFLVDYSPKWLSSTFYHDSIVAKDDIIPEIKSRVRLYEPLWGVLVSDKPFKVTHLYLFSVRTSVNVYMLVQQVSVLLFLLISTEHGVQLRLLTWWHKMKSSVNDQSYYNSSRGRRLEWTSGAIFTAIHLTRETLRPGSERWSGPQINRHDETYSGNFVTCLEVLDLATSDFWSFAWTSDKHFHTERELWILLNSKKNCIKMVSKI